MIPLPLLIVGAVALIALSSRVNKLSTIAADIVGFWIHKVELVNTICKINLELTNPSSASLRINSVFLKIMFEGNQIGLLTKTTNFDIAPKTTQVRQTELSLNNLKTIRLIGSALASNKPIPVQFQGYVNADGVEIKVNKNIPLDLGSFRDTLKSLI